MWVAGANEVGGGGRASRHFGGCEEVRRAVANSHSRAKHVAAKRKWGAKLGAELGAAVGAGTGSEVGVRVVGAAVGSPGYTVGAGIGAPEGLAVGA